MHDMKHLQRSPITSSVLSFYLLSIMTKKMRRKSKIYPGNLAKISVLDDENIIYSLGSYLENKRKEDLVDYIYYFRK